MVFVNVFTFQFQITSRDQSAASAGSGISPLPTRNISTTSSRAFDAHQLIILGLVLVTALVIFAALRFGGGYYWAALAERTQHALHKMFKPSGLIGQGFGVIGGLFCVLTLLYPMRKRWRWLENLGAQRNWFLYHIYFGIAGPLFATLHTTFKFGGLASICYWSMMLVMASGFVGRFLFAQLPRNKRGLALSLQEITAEIKSIQRALENAGLSEEEMNLLVNTSGKKLKDEGRAKPGWRQILRLWTTRRRHLRMWKQRLQEHDFTPTSIHNILSLLSRKMFLEGSLATLALTTRAFSHWHSLHLPFTYLMFLTLLIHASLAIFLGYTWIF